MLIVRILVLTLGCLLYVQTPSNAQQSTSTVVLAPISSLSETSSSAIAKAEALVEQGLRKVANTKVVTAKESRGLSRKARKPELRSCAGDVVCLSKLGSIAGATYTVFAELTDLGQTQIMYLKLVDVKTSKEIRSTTLQLNNNSASSESKTLASHAAATRLLAPKLHIGSLAVTSSVKGATVFIDGHKIGKTPSSPIAIYVGSHALRVTHPEARDYVRFVDIKFGEATVIDANLKSLPGVSKELTRTTSINPLAGTTTIVKQKSTPWYLRWYTIAGGAAAIAITSAILFQSDGIDSDCTIVIGSDPMGNCN